MASRTPSIDLTQPHDTCVRCGRPTPQGVSLCEDDNPAALKGPSTTQVHGTIVVGIGVGFVLLALAAQWLLGSIGPFPVDILAATLTDDGGAEIVFTVGNEGPGESVATCRITRGGVGTPSDPVFRTAAIPAGAEVQVVRSIPPPGEGEPPWVAERLLVRCT